MLMLAIAGARQAGPDVPVLGDGGRDSSGRDVAQRALLLDLLERDAVLADQAEIMQAELLAVVIPVADQLLVAPGRRGADAQRRQRDQLSQVIGIGPLSKAAGSALGTDTG